MATGYTRMHGHHISGARYLIATSEALESPTARRHFKFQLSRLPYFLIIFAHKDHFSHLHNSFTLNLFNGVRVVAWWSRPARVVHERHTSSTRPRALQRRDSLSEPVDCSLPRSDIHSTPPRQLK